MVITSVAGMRKEFIVSYAGEATYRVGRQLYRVRHYANVRPGFGYSAGTLEQFIAPLVGCVIADGSDHWYEFPPAEVVALFPGFVGARYTRPDEATGDRGFRAEYDGAEPVRFTDEDVPHYLTCDAGRAYAGY